jgi:hypothetical protein
MTIRTFQPGDEIAQVSIFNEAAATLPKFKAATVDEVRRRIRTAEFDPSTRFYAIEEGVPVGYATFQANGRINYPWSRQGKEHCALALFARVLESMKERGLTRPWAAYRGDWQAIGEFFLGQGFAKTREVCNFVLDLVEMPTPAARAATAISPLRTEDLPLLKQAAPNVLRASLTDIEKAWFRNSWYPPSSLFCLRHRTENRPLAVGALILNSVFADPKLIDSSMPCFRLGAFGAEGLTVKRVNGLFSFFTADPQDTNALGVDLLGHAARLMQDVNGETIAAQVSSDVPHLVRFYKQYFRPQGTFPIFERAL